MVFFLMVLNLILIGQRSLKSTLFLQRCWDALESRYQVSSDVSNIPIFSFVIRTDIVSPRIKSLESELSLYSIALLALVLDQDS